MLTNRWIRRTAAVGLIVVVASGCSALKSKESSIQIDPPQGKDAAATMAQMQAADAKNLMQVTLYMKDPNGYLAPITMGIPKAEGIAKATVEQLVQGGPSEGKLPQGFSAVLPKGTQVKGINIKDKLAVVEFNKEFTKYDAKDERKIMEAVTWTLTGFNTVDNVQIWVDGKMLKEMPVGKTPINDSLTRAMGINIEQENGVDIGQTTPVTVYFQGQTADNYTYYVPVTRLVKRTEDKAMAAMKQLIQGPNESKSHLKGTIANTAEVLGVKLSDDKQTVTVNLSDKILGPDQKAPAEALQTVILSLTENTGAAKVQIMVNGKSKVDGTDNQSYSKPVTRPTQINQIKL